MKRTALVGLIAVFLGSEIAYGENWECLDRANGKTLITNTPTPTENFVCMAVNHKKVAFNKVDSQFFEGYIREAKIKKEILLGFLPLLDNEQKEKIIDIKSDRLKE